MPNSSADNEDWYEAHSDWEEVEGSESEDSNPFPHLPWWPEVVRQSKGVLDRIAAEKIAEKALIARQSSGTTVGYNPVIIRNDEKI